MANSVYVTWGAVSYGKLSREPMPLNEGVCGENTVVTGFDAVSNQFPRIGMTNKGYTRFYCSAKCTSYGYCLWNGGVIALKPNVFATGSQQSIYVDKSNPPESFSFVLCATLIPVNYSNLVDVVGSFFVNSDGQYLDKDGNVVAFPNGITLTVGSIPDTYLGSDGKLYDSNGVETSFDGSITYTQYGSFYKGSDGNFYDTNGNQVFEDIPSDIVPVGVLGNATLFSDGNYYKLDGNLAFSQLPAGVSIVSYDSVHDNYVGSDGLKYDIDGNLTSDCNGVLMNYNNTIRLEIIGVDIFGNDVSIGGNVTVGQSSVEFPQGTLIREIKRIVARNLNENSSCGFGNLTIKADVVGAKIGLDLEGVDIDAVLGQYVVCNCIFDACDKYADYVMNDDIPLGFTNMTALDIGYYCCTSVFQLFWQGFDNSEFPYCCGSYDNTVNESDGLGKTTDKLDVDVDCLCEHLGSIDDSFIELNNKVASLIDSVDSLLCICSKIDDLISAINNKDFSITVQPATPSVTVTNPVNNITVEPCSPVVTNPVNNITVQPATPSVTVTNPVNNITVEPCEPVIQNTINEGDCSTDLTPLIDKIDEVFKTGSDDDARNITQVIDDKDFGGFTDVTIEPYDFVNIRRAFRDDNLRE